MNKEFMNSLIRHWSHFSTCYLPWSQQFLKVGCEVKYDGTAGLTWSPNKIFWRPWAKTIRIFVYIILSIPDREAKRIVASTPPHLTVKQCQILICDSEQMKCKVPKETVIKLLGYTSALCQHLDQRCWKVRNNQNMILHKLFCVKRQEKTRNCYVFRKK